MGLALEGFTEQEIKDALHGKKGRQHYRFRYELLNNNGARIRDLNATKGTVSLDHNNAIQRGLTLTIYDDNVDWLKNKIKVYMGVRIDRAGTTQTVDYNFFGALWETTENLTWEEIDRGYITNYIPAPSKWAEWPLGVFIPSTPTKKTGQIHTEQKWQQKTEDYNFFGALWETTESLTWNEIDAGHIKKSVLISSELKGTASYDVECYDLTVILKEDAFTTRYFIASGTAYLTAVQNILVSAGIEHVIVTKDSAVKIAIDREWDIGTSKLDIINTLLEEINYNPIYCDARGYMVVSPYIEPTSTNVTYEYAADELSVIAAEMSSTQDFYNVPNVFIATSQNPDSKQDYRSVYINDNPVSPTSTVQRGRTIVSRVYQLDSVASQAELDAYIKKQAFDASQIYEEIQFTTALMPIHSSGDVLSLRHPAASGIYQEISWEMDLSNGGQMTHVAKRLAKI